MATGTDMLISSLMRLAGIDPDQIKAVAQELVSKGLLEKLMLFADNMDRTNQLLEQISRDYAQTCSKCGADIEGQDNGRSVAPAGSGEPASYAGSDFTV